MLFMFSFVVVANEMRHVTYIFGFSRYVMLTTHGPIKYHMCVYSTVVLQGCYQVNLIEFLCYLAELHISSLGLSVDSGKKKAT